MTNPAKTTFVYVTFIRTTPDKLWSALTDPATTPKYWFGMHLDSDWKAGSSWNMVRSNGEVTDTGDIIKADPPRRLVLKWRNEFRPELKAEGYSRCTLELEPMDDVVKLSVVHEIDRAESLVIAAVSGGWPRILSNLKSLLETGDVIFKA